jgi:DHA2 family multidrug resistance protein-like MFS transporter
VSGALFVVGVDMTVLNVALPTIGRELNASASDKIWIVNAYSLIMAGLLPGFGALSDKVGHRTMLTIGLTVFGISSVGAALAFTPGLLIFARGLLAVGAALMMPAALSIVRMSFRDAKQRVVAISMCGAIWSAAAAVGPILGGVLLSHFHWGAVFLINIPIVAATAILARAYIPMIPGNPAQHWDVLGSAMLTASLICLILSIKAALAPHFSIVYLLLTLFSFLTFAAFFILCEKWESSPMIDFALFLDGQFSLGFLVALTAGFALIGTQFLLSQELQLVQELSPLEASAFLFPMAVASFLSAPIASAMTARLGVTTSMTVALAISFAGATFIFSSYSLSNSLAQQSASLIIFGIGMGGVAATASTAILVAAPEQRVGTAASIEIIAYELGGTLGVATMGNIVASTYAAQARLLSSVDYPSIPLETLEGTLAFASNIRGDAFQKSLIDGAKAAYMHGVSFSFAVSALLLLIAFACAVVRTRRLAAHRDTGR